MIAGVELKTVWDLLKVFVGIVKKMTIVLISNSSSVQSLQYLSLEATADIHKFF